MGMAKYDRLFFILNLLRTRRNLNAAMIASECGVTERSIYRDVIALSEANIPIYYDRGYKLASDNFLPPLNFDFDEYQYLHLALNSSPLNKTERYGRVSRQVKVKLQAVLSSDVKKRYRFTPETTHIDIDISESTSEEFFGPIERAIETSGVIDLVYDSVRSGLTERKVEPYFIIFKGHAFYFVAFCRLRGEFRTFRLSRVREMKPTGETFVPRDDVTVEKYFEGSWQIYSGEPVEVVIRFTGVAARVVANDSHHVDETIERVGDDEVIYRVVTRGLEEIQRWILGFGDEATVISPEELRQNLARIGACLKKKY